MPRVRDTARHKSRIVFFGDSICVGQGVSIHKSWVSRIAARIDELQPSLKQNLVVVNASINGNTTRQALERMPYDVQSHGVAILIVQFGMNDCNYWLSDRGLPRVSERGFAANLEEIVMRGFRFGAQRVLINTNHPTTLDDSPMIPDVDVTYEASNRRYNAIIREVASRMDSRVVLNDAEARCQEATSGKREALAKLLLDDGLHLSVPGHDLYFDLIFPTLANIVRELFETRAEASA